VLFQEMPNPASVTVRSWRKECWKRKKKVGKGIFASSKNVARDTLEEFKQKKLIATET